MARFFPDLRSLFGEDELYKIFNVSVLSTPWEGTRSTLHNNIAGQHKKQTTKHTLRLVTNNNGSQSIAASTVFC